MSQLKGNSQPEQSSSNGVSESSVSVSSMTETPWGNLVRKSSHSSVNLASTKISSYRRNGPTANESKNVISASKPALPGSKPSLPGPKPALPGPKPALPGPKPALHGSKSSLPSFKTVSLLPGSTPPVPNSKTASASILPDSKPSLSGPKSSVNTTISSPSTNPSFKKPLLPSGATQKASKMTDIEGVRSPRMLQLETSPKFPHRSPHHHIKSSPGPPPSPPTQKPSGQPNNSSLDGPPTPPLKPKSLSATPPALPGKLTAKSASNPPEPPKKPSKEPPWSSAASVNRFEGRRRIFEQKTLPPDSKGEIWLDSMEKSQSLPTDLNKISARSRSNAMEAKTSKTIRSSLERRSTRSSSHETEEETQRKSISIESSDDDSFEVIEAGSDDLQRVISSPLTQDGKEGGPTTSNPPVIEVPHKDTPPEDIPTKPKLTPEELAEKNRKKRHNIAQELLDTEEKYVQKLRLIAVEFHGAVVDINKQKVILPDSVLNQIFLNIKQIYQFNEELLSSLQEMLQKWDEKEELGLRLSRLAPFLRLYAHYTSRFDTAMETLTEYSKKEKKFDVALKEFESSPACGHLGVAHHMLEPVQRIPRYRLLLVDYLKHLPEDSPDYEPSQKALEIISEAADKANNRIKELENLNEIQAIQRSLQDYDQILLAPGRTYVKKGRLYKFSRKTTHLKMFFLFSDILIHANVAGTGGYKCRNVMPVLGMKVVEPPVSPQPHTFIVVSTTRSLTLAATSEEEKVEWIETLRRTISELKSKTLTFKKLDIESIDMEGFGVKAPVWVPDEHVSMCMLCCTPFTFTFRRHHCRACGKVICANCFKYKVFLLYKGKEDKVCSYCFDYAKSLGLVEGPDNPAPTDSTDHQHHKTALDVSAYGEDAVMAGYVMLSEGRQKWAKYWFQLKNDCVLYRFKAHEDVRALESIPLPGYKVEKEGENVITLVHPHKPYKLKFEDEDIDKWMDLLTKAAFLRIS